MRKPDSSISISPKRWQRYCAAGLLALGSSTALQADENHQRCVWFDEIVDVDIADSNNGDGLPELFGPYSFGSYGPIFSIGHWGSDVNALYAVGVGNVSFAGFQAGNYFYGSRIGSGEYFSSFNFVPGSNRIDLAWGDGYPNSQWDEGGFGYLGLRFDVGLGTQYGWIALDAFGQGLNEAHLSRFGWALPGVSIPAGAVCLVPEPSSLSLLALGAFGIAVWRQRRSASFG